MPYDSGDYLQKRAADVFSGNEAPDSSELPPVSLYKMALMMEQVSAETHVFYHPTTATYMAVSGRTLQMAEARDLPDSLMPWEMEELNNARLLLDRFDEFAELPTQRQINEYAIMRSFAEDCGQPNVAAALNTALIGRGAFRRFRETLRALEMSGEWHDYRFEIFRQIADAWCAHHGLQTLSPEQDVSPASEAMEGDVMLARAQASDMDDVASVAVLLWPEHPLQELKEELVAQARDTARCAFFIVRVDGEAVGFAQCSLRTDYVEGSSGGTVGYLEGIYVKENARRHGLARALVDSCQQWAADCGCREFASDCAVDNQSSARFHAAMGFREAARVICLIKSLDDVTGGAR